MQTLHPILDIKFFDLYLWFRKKSENPLFPGGERADFRSPPAVRGKLTFYETITI